MDEFKIRRAINDDVPKLLDLGLALFVESRYSERMDFSRPRCGDMFRHCIANGFFELAEATDGAFVGMMFGLANPTYFSTSIQAVELACYALREWRGRAVCDQMVEHFRGWAKRIGAVEVMVGSSASINTEGVRRFYGRHGFEVVGDLMARRT